MLFPSLFDEFKKAPTPIISSTPIPTDTPNPISTFTPSVTEMFTLTPIALCPTPTTPLPKNAELAKCAWDFFNVDMYNQSVTASEECIDQFESQALQQQQEFIASGSPAPPIGKPTSDSSSDEILARGPLNDVATCYFIKGWSLEKLGRINES